MYIIQKSGTRFLKKHCQKKNLKNIGKFLLLLAQFEFLNNCDHCLNKNKFKIFVSNTVQYPSACNQNSPTALPLVIFLQLLSRLKFLSSKKGYHTLPNLKKLMILTITQHLRLKNGFISEMIGIFLRLKI